MVVLVDTNVLLDVISMREPYAENSIRVIEHCALRTVQGYIAVHSISNIYFILRKVYTDAERRKIILNYMKFLTVAGIGHEQMVEALNRDNFKDFEDCLQDECAKELKADYIITRNIKDFAHSKIPAVTPEQFLEVIA